MKSLITVPSQSIVFFIMCNSILYVLPMVFNNSKSSELYVLVLLHPNVLIVRVCGASQIMRDASHPILHMLPCGRCFTCDIKVSEVSQRDSSLAVVCKYVRLFLPVHYQVSF